MVKPEGVPLRAHRFATLSNALQRLGYQKASPAKIDEDTLKTDMTDSSKMYCIALHCVVSSQVLSSSTRRSLRRALRRTVKK